MLCTGIICLGNIPKDIENTLVSSLPSWPEGRDSFFQIEPSRRRTPAWLVQKTLLRDYRAQRKILREEAGTKRIRADRRSRR